MLLDQVEGSFGPWRGREGRTPGWWGPSGASRRGSKDMGLIVYPSAWAILGVAGARKKSFLKQSLGLGLDQ